MNLVKKHPYLIALGVLVVIALAFWLKPVIAETGVIRVVKDASLKEVVLELKDILRETSVETPVEPEPKLGALTSPDLPYNYIGVGGQRLAYYGRNLIASSTSCSFNPDFGTTTIRSLAFQTHSTTTGTTLTIAKATNNNNATTTLIAEHTFAAGIKGTLFLVASTTDSSGAGDGVDDEWTLGPNDVLNFDVQGLVNEGEGASSTTIPGLVSSNWTLGTCGVEFWVH